MWLVAAGLMWLWRQKKKVFPMAASKFNRFLLERQKRNIEPRSALSSQSMILIADTQRMPVLGMGTGATCVVGPHPDHWCHIGS